MNTINNDPNSYDAIVVGTGISGGWAAKELCEKGLKTLPTKCREVVNLSMNGYKNKQISEELDISMNTVKTQKKIAYKKLRLFLKPSLITFLIVLLRIN